MRYLPPLLSRQGVVLTDLQSLRDCQSNFSLSPSLGSLWKCRPKLGGEGCVGGRESYMRNNSCTCKSSCASFLVYTFIACRNPLCLVQSPSFPLTSAPLAPSSSVSKSFSSVCDKNVCISALSATTANCAHCGGRAGIRVSVRGVQRLSAVSHSHNAKGCSCVCL
jgi:hypothetical protein